MKTTVCIIMYPHTRGFICWIWQKYKRKTRVKMLTIIHRIKHSLLNSEFATPRKSARIFMPIDSDRKIPQIYGNQAIHFYAITIQRYQMVFMGPVAITATHCQPWSPASNI